MVRFPTGKLRPFVLLALLAFSWAACRPEPDAELPSTSSPIPATVTAAEPETETATPAVLLPSSTTTPSATTEPSAIPDPTPTASPAPTNTQAPEVVAVVIRDFAIVYSGPAEVFEAIITLTGGIAVNLQSRNAAGTWFYADLLLGQGGWISSGSVRIEGEVEALEILETPAIPTATPTPGSPPVISVLDINTLALQNFKLHENVILTVVQVQDPATAESRNCVITDPAVTLCPFFNRNRIGAQYRITAQGDQGSFAETLYTREE